MDFISQKISEIRSSDSFRQLRLTSGLIDFSSNDYLGLSTSEVIRDKLIKFLREGCSLGSTGSRLLSGETEWNQVVEGFISQLYGVPSALLFTSGYSANLSLTGALGSIGAEFFSDENNHASLIDGMRLAKSKKTLFRHNDMKDLEAQLSKSESALKVIVTESVFSQDGDFAPLADLAELSAHYDAWLVVDEAHATGVFGKSGLGLSYQFVRNRNKLISVHTGGKALGAQGAYVLSNLDIRSLLINRSRAFIFSTGISPLNALQLKFALEESFRAELKREYIQKRTALFHSICGVHSSPHTELSPIIPLVIGSNQKVLRVQNVLSESGYDVRAIRAPAVRAGSERLRITIKSFNLDGQISGLAHLIKELL